MPETGQIWWPEDGQIWWPEDVKYDGPRRQIWWSATSNM